MNNKVSVVVVVVISKTFKFEKQSQYKSQSFRPCAFFAWKYEDHLLQS